MKHIFQAFAVLALLPLLISAGQAASTAPAPPALQCHYEQEIEGAHTLPDGSTIEVPIGRIAVSECSSPQDLAQRVELLTEQVRAQATAQAAR